MSAKGRYRKLPLSQAWKHYWPQLFAGGRDWESDLQSEIRKRLIFPAGDYSFPSFDHAHPKEPEWAKALDVDVTEMSVTIRIHTHMVPNIPIFLNRSVLSLSNWSGVNPVEAAASSENLSENAKTEIRDLSIAAVAVCGQAIQGIMLSMLKSLQPPNFEISAASPDDSFAGIKKIRTSALQKVAQLDMNQSQLTNRLGLPELDDVHIKLVEPKKGKAEAHGAFHANDDKLIREIRQPSIALPEIPKPERGVVDTRYQIVASSCVLNICFALCCPTGLLMRRKSAIRHLSPCSSHFRLDLMFV